MIPNPKYKQGTAVIINSGAVRNVRGTVRAVSKATGNLTVEIDHRPGYKVCLMPYEVRLVSDDVAAR